MQVREILEKLKNAEISVDIASELLKSVSIADLGHTKLDLDRTARTGFGEVIFAQGKTPQQLVDIFTELKNRKINALATRVSEDSAKVLAQYFEDIKIDNLSHTAVLYSAEVPQPTGLIAIVTAGTSDMPVAIEAKAVAEFFGNKVECFFDCGVAGLHRLLSKLENIRKANVVIAIAGMEGALASVVAGLVKTPVIAVPTSVGYGANFQGLSALLSMINSCANGVSVVNIDNGYGAAYIASVINRRSK